MADTTYEEARRCPKCSVPGQRVGDKNAKGGRPGSRIHTFACRNSRCLWFNTTYIIQVNADGTVPPPDIHRRNAFPKLPPRSNEDVERQNQAILDATLRGAETR